MTTISAFRLANSVSIYPQHFTCHRQINWCTFIINSTQDNVNGHTNTSVLMNYFVLDPRCFVMTTKQGEKNLTREQHKRIIILLAFNCPHCHQNKSKENSSLHWHLQKKKSGFFFTDLEFENNNIFFTGKCKNFTWMLLIIVALICSLRICGTVHITDADSLALK